jgi:hypothetical protein
MVIFCGADFPEEDGTTRGGATRLAASAAQAALFFLARQGVIGRSARPVPNRITTEDEATHA